MSTTVYARWLGAGLLAIALVALTAPPLYAAPTVASAETTTPGTFTFLARGFLDNESVSTWLTGPRQQVQASGIFAADRRGDVHFSLRMPRHFEPGRWAITVHGLKSDREAIGFFWMPALQPTIPLTALPEQGPPGTTFVFRSTGFRAGEQVNYWLTSPDDIAYTGGEIRARNDGSVEFAFPIGPGTRPGGWAMTAYGMRSDHLAVTRFTIT